MGQVPNKTPTSPASTTEQSDRRKFVKGVVGTATLAGAGTTATAVVESATGPAGEGGGIREYVGISNIDGPAPRAMPMIPVEISDDGYLRGVWPEPEEREQDGRTVTVAEMELGGRTYSTTWFQYCGVQELPGIEPDADQDNHFRSAARPGYDWQAETLSEGDRLHIDDFADYEEWGNDVGSAGMGKPAMVNWRSVDLKPQKRIPVQVLRSTHVEQMVADAKEPMKSWLEASIEEDFIAWLSKCTHYCCVPNFKGYAGSANFDAADKIYCVCHQSVYDPFQVTKDSFTAYPRPE